MLRYPRTRIVRLRVKEPLAIGGECFLFHDRAGVLYFTLLGRVILTFLFFWLLE
jgi:hypothetical protein